MVYSIISLWMWLLHPIHISVTEIEYDEKERELEIITRIFTDDFESAIRTQRNLSELDVLNPPHGLTTGQLVSEYLLKQITISLDGKAQKLHYLGFEDDGEALVCYLQAREVRKWKTLSVKNTVLLELFDDQSNIVHVTVRGKVRSMRLMRNNSSQSVTFDE